MQKQPLLHAIYLPLKSPQQIAAALRRARLCRERARTPATTLFFCDLPDAAAAQLPTDAGLIRCVQSGVSGMNARCPGAYLFLVRRRTRSNALKTYLGEHQTPCIRESLSHLLRGENPCCFEASNFSASSLVSSFDAVLITHADLRMTPDLPMRMHEALRRSGETGLCGEIVIPFRPEEPLLTRLLREGFTLEPPVIHENNHEALAAIYADGALDGISPLRTAAGCRFVRDVLPTLADLFYLSLLHDLRAENKRFLFAPAQLAALLVSAFLGWQWLALGALFLPELPALAHPRQLPGTLVRLSLLPRCALTALNALLCRRFSRTRFGVQCCTGTGSCVFFGLLLLFLAARGIGALAALLPVSLLWLGAPALDRALSLPVRERIPLEKAEENALSRLTLDAFSALSPDAKSPAHLLAACAGCMLGELEADEAARRAEGMLGFLVPSCAFDAACCLCAAQFFQENMACCDAALRPLPTALEACAASYRPSEGEGFLAALVRIAQDNIPSPEAASILRAEKQGTAMDALFLPAQQTVGAPALLPITHPHTYIRHAMRNTEKSEPPSETERANRFLVLACAALDAPFSQLFTRSTLIAPYAPLLDLCRV